MSGEGQVEEEYENCRAGWQVCRRGMWVEGNTEATGRTAQVSLNPKTLKP